jgi:hypothetical protein
VVIDNYNIEFGYELIGIVPYAYWLHGERALTKTISNKDTGCIYYFSPDHEIRDERRHSRMWGRVREAYDNGYVHKKVLDTSRWVPPPYRQHYKNSDFSFKKPPLIVCNKYNAEWKKPPVNYLDLDSLRWIFENFSDKYHIIYNRFRPEMGYDDTVDTMDLGEWGLVSDYGITTIQDLKTEEVSYNLLQLKLYTHCVRFITVQGGTSVLASYFGGDNIIFAKSGMEVKRGTYSWYHLLGGSKIHHADSYDALKACCKKVLSLS